MARTSREWWSVVKATPGAMIAWLEKQYHGEIGAAERIERHCRGGDPRWNETLLRIAADERRHAEWVGDLLRARGVEPVRREGPERYWERTLGQIRSFENAAAVAHHAETMRLERIRVIAGDPDAPTDVRDVFARILPDEDFHARAFAAMSTPAAIERARPAHLSAQASIGLLSQTATSTR
jgi:rubrerythrin